MKRFVVWISALAIVVLVAIALSACAEFTTCYGVEPDGEVETLVPCPPGWQNGETRNIKEDEFEAREWD